MKLHPVVDLGSIFKNHCISLLKKIDFYNGSY